jgi:hypothetical protein
MRVAVRVALCWFIIVSLAGSLVASDAGAAMLYAKGTTWLNGAAVPHSSAIFPGDMVQTKSDALANINAPGSNVIVLPDSLLKYEGSVVLLERGGITVATSKNLSTRIGEIAVTPTGAGQQAEFEVIDKGKTIQIMARRGDLSLHEGAETSAVPQGQQIEVEKKKIRKRGAAAVRAGNKPLITSKTAIVGGVVGACVLVLCRPAGTPDEP